MEDNEENMWTDDQKRAIVGQYRKTKVAYCPYDKELLAVLDVGTRDAPRAVILSCDACGQSFESGDYGLE